VSQFLSIDADASVVLTALAGVGPSVERKIKAASKITADNILREWVSRMRRRTGQTAESIKVEEARNGEGYVIYSGNRQHIARFNEFGTKFMTARPAGIPAMEIERGPHDRRIIEAINDGIRDKGLGE